MQIIENVDPSCRDCAESAPMKELSDVVAPSRVVLEVFSLLDSSPEEIVERLSKRRVRKDRVAQTLG